MCGREGGAFVLFEKGVTGCPGAYATVLVSADRVDCVLLPLVLLLIGDTCVFSYRVL